VGYIDVGVEVIVVAGVIVGVSVAKGVGVNVVPALSGIGVTEGVGGEILGGQQYPSFQK